MKTKTMAAMFLGAALAASTARADTANGDMSDRGGDTFEHLSGQSWGRYDGSDAVFFEHFLGPDWRCSLLGEGCPAALPLLPSAPPPIPEPRTWVLLLVGVGALCLRRRLNLAP